MAVKHGWRVVAVVQNIILAAFTLQKLKNDVSVLQKSRMPDKEKSKWMTVLHPGFISSDHSASGTDSEDDTLVTQPLEWRSKRVTEFFYQLDVYVEEGKSAQAKKQMKESACRMSFISSSSRGKISFLGSLW